MVKGHPSMVRKIPFALAELLGKEVDSDKNIVEGQMSFFDMDEGFMSDEDVSETTNKVEEISIQKVYMLGD